MNVIIQILLSVSLFVIPITLIVMGVIGKQWRLWVAFIVFFIVLTTTYFQNVFLEDLNIYLGEPFLYFLPYLLATVCGVVFIILLAKLLHKKHAKYWYKDWHFLFLFIPISIAQQFLYQAFLLRHLENYFTALISVLITAAIFGYMHAIYPRPFFSLFFGTLAGLFFGTLYSFYPNLILISISHMILNFTAVFFSFFTILDEEERPKRTELTISAR